MLEIDTGLREAFRLETYLSQHQIIGNVEYNHSLICNAQHLQVLTVLTAIQQLHLLTVNKGSMIANQTARTHVLNGLGKRTRTIWVNLRRIYHEIPPDRNEPLASEDNIELSDRINSIYINLRGSLDNAAWALLATEAPNSKLSQTAVNLFDSRWQRETNLVNLPFLDNHSKWFTEMKDRRDPAAHRIPLSFVPAILNSTHLQKRKILTEQVYNLNMRLGHIQDDAQLECILEEIQQCYDNIEKLGDFLPMFVFDPGQQPVPLYPTLTTDIAHVIEVIEGCLEVITLKQ